ncbi:DUF1559 domain-containing protein [Paludisphaera rhizosphaerae]|uniref:DUF1559 domain-containing protein n=1 Tax=Paludisphaera rhizosphaerae TaxID=2711216 RepID=UPI0013EABB6D|nr:DUF1559 domain-containing protein [Paludisphaera rhizosphaerae]
MRRRSGFTLIEMIVVLGIIAVILSLMLSAFHAGNEAARRIQCMNNLKQIHLALNSYYETHSVLPPGAVASTHPLTEGTAGHRIDWIGSLLPFMEQYGIYQTLNFEVTVEHAANMTAANCRISALACPDSYPRDDPAYAYFLGQPLTPRSIPLPGLTSYVGCHNDVEKTIDVDDHGVFFLNSRVRMADVADGLSQTFFVGEVAAPTASCFLASGRTSLRNTGAAINGVEVEALGELARSTAWQSSAQTPEALESLLKAGTVSIPPGYVGGFGSRHLGNGAIFAFGDGSVRFIRASIEQSVYRRLGNRNDGEEIDDAAY